MNRQETFDTVKRHLLTQNRKGSNSLGRCKYRGTGGTKCAVGALIPDQLYKKAMDGASAGGIYALVECFPEMYLALDIERPEDIRFLCDLQNIHDGYDVELWPEELEDFARNHKLNP